MMKRNRTGFTLVELLVVIAIIGVLVALLLPAVQAAREAARRTKCVNNLKQLSLGSLNHADVRRYLPASATDRGGSYVYQILPYIEESALYESFTFTSTSHIANVVNASYWGRSLAIVRCPSQGSDSQTVTSSVPAPFTIYEDDNDWRSHYLAVMGGKKGCTTPSAPDSQYTMIAALCPSTGAISQTGGSADNGVMYPESRTRFREVTDGLSKTLILGEVSWDAGVTRVWAVGSQKSPSTSFANGHKWSTYGGRNLTSPINTFSDKRIDVTGIPLGPANDISFGSMHSGGAHFAFGDGSCHFISENIERNLYIALGSKSGHETFLMFP